MRASGRRGAQLAAIEAILLAGIIVAAGLAVLAYTTWLLEQRRAAHEQAFIADNVWFWKDATDAKKVTIWIFNHGSVPTNIRGVYIWEAAEATPHTVTHYEVDLALEPGRSGQITLDFSWQSGTIYVIKLTSAGGNYYEGFWRA